MHQLRRISKNAIPAALEKAMRYRLLNEPQEAESICLDVLAVDADHAEALVMLLLALTDQFDKEYTEALSRAREVLPRLPGGYEQAYYEGIINERWAKAQLDRGVPDHVVCGWFREAMQCYQSALSQAAPGNPDAVLRWNACARILARHEPAELLPESMTRDVDTSFGDEMPLR
jgi:hypothetical protein